MKRSYVILLLSALAAAGLATTTWSVFAITPLDYQLYYSQKIFYYHVPNAFVLFTAVFVCGIASIGVLRRLGPGWDDMSLASAELAGLAGLIVLVTGSIWGKAAWGHWWIWEPRLVTSLVLWLIVVGYVLLRRFAGPGSERLAAGLAVFGMVDVPLIYFGVKQGDAHPKPEVVQQLDISMSLTFWGSVLTFFLFYAALLLYRAESVRAEREVRELRERALDAGLMA